MEQPFALIIEDERDIASLFRHVLDMAGYRTEAALNGQAGMHRLETIRPDLVLLDLNLPGVPGAEILTAIRKDRRLLYTRVIVVTAHAHIVENLSAEPDLVLLKPISVEQITELFKRFQATIKRAKTIPLQVEPWDRVTDLYNKTFFINRLNFSIKHAQEDPQYTFAVLALALNPGDNLQSNLKMEQWIALLREIANMIKATVRPTDTVARFDQDQFYILVEDVPNDVIPRQIAARIQNKVIDYQKQNGDMGASPLNIGTVVCSTNYERAEDILVAVDEAADRSAAKPR